MFTNANIKPEEIGFFFRKSLKIITNKKTMALEELIINRQFKEAFNLVANYVELEDEPEQYKDFFVLTFTTYW